MGLTRVLGGILFLALLHSPVQALGATQSLKLAWRPSEDSSVTGYKVYYRDVASTTMVVGDAGNATVFTVTNLLEAVTYSFFVTAYNAQGLESDPSNTVEVMVPLGRLEVTVSRDQAGSLVMGFQIDGVAGRQVGLEWSSNLKDWSTVSISDWSQPLWCQVTNVPGDAGRFYRSVCMP